MAAQSTICVVKVQLFKYTSKETNILFNVMVWPGLKKVQIVT